jgi:hypothetical protein
MLTILTHIIIYAHVFHVIVMVGFFFYDTKLTTIIFIFFLLLHLIKKETLTAIHRNNTLCVYSSNASS